MEDLVGFIDCLDGSFLFELGVVEFCVYLVMGGNVEIVYNVFLMLFVGKVVWMLVDEELDLIVVFVFFEVYVEIEVIVF